MRRRRSSRHAPGRVEPAGACGDEHVLAVVTLQVCARRSTATRVPIRRRDRRTNSADAGRRRFRPRRSLRRRRATGRRLARDGLRSTARHGRSGAVRVIRRGCDLASCCGHRQTIPPPRAAKHWTQIPDRSGVFPTSKRPCVRHDERVLTSLRRRAVLLVWSVTTFVTSLLSLVLFIASAVGAALITVWVGIPILVVRSAVTRVLADHRRRYSGGLIGRTIPSPYLRRPTGSRSHASARSPLDPAVPSRPALAVRGRARSGLRCR